MPLFRRKLPEPLFDPNPGEIEEMPARPYRVLHADMPFYSDPECRIEVPDGRLIVLRCEDPKQKHWPTECMPSRKKYQKDQLVQWEINHKKLWEASWYLNPETGSKEKAWVQAVEFVGNVVKPGVRTSLPGSP